MKDAARFLQDGGVVAAATETFFGLLADASQPAAIDALFRIKPRSAGVALIVPSVEVWETLVTAIPPRARALAETFWPGPLTIALPATAGLDPRLVVNGTVGARLPGPSTALDLCRAYGRALTATSANPHGQAPPTRAEDVRTAFAESIAAGELLVLDGVCPGGQASTFVAVGETVSILREGAISAVDIEAASRRPL